MITVLVSDDHALLREMLCRRLQEEPGIEVVASTASADEAIAAANSFKPDIALMDIEMPGVSVFEAVKEIRQASPNTRIIYLSAFVQDGYIQSALDARASGYLTKSEESDDVVRAIRSVANGFTSFSAEVRSRLVLDGDGARLADRAYTRPQLLTKRELEILGYLARGMAKKEVARNLSISVKTVEAHSTHIMEKLDIHDRVELARFAVREGLVTL